jgi:hypothetical protein
MGERQRSNCVKLLVLSSTSMQETLSKLLETNILSATIIRVKKTAQLSVLQARNQKIYCFRL